MHLEKDPTIYSNIYTTLGTSTAWTKPEYYFDNGSDQNFWVAAVSAVRVVLDGQWGNQIPVFYYRRCTIIFTVNALIATNPDYNGAIYPPGYVDMVCGDGSLEEYYYTSYFSDFIYSTPSELPARILTFNPTYPGTPGPVPTPGTSPSPSPSSSPSPTPSPNPSPSSSPTPNPTPSPTPTTPLALRVTFIKDNDADPDVNGNSTTAIIAPSFDSCGELPSRTALRSFKVECINPTSGAVVSGCQLSADLALGTEHGGHEHDFDSRPRGVIYPQLAAIELIPIPSGGAEISYESPEVAGDVDVTLTGVGPDGQNLTPAYVRFNVKTEGFGPLANAGLYFVVKSHSTGVKGTNRLKDKLLELVTTFEKMTKRLIVTPKLQSQGASLPLGGLLDIEYDEGKSWTWPHCEHRDGDIVDISFSSFRDYDPTTKAFLHSALEDAFKKVGFKAPVHKRNHWHAKLK